MCALWVCDRAPWSRCITALYTDWHMFKFYLSFWYIWREKKRPRSLKKKKKKGEMSPVTLFVFYVLSILFRRFTSNLLKGESCLHVSSSACKLTSSPGRCCLGECSCARPRRCSAWGRLSAAGSAPARRQKHTWRYVNTHVCFFSWSLWEWEGKCGRRVKQSSQTTQTQCNTISSIVISLAVASENSLLAST